MIGEIQYREANGVCYYCGRTTYISLQTNGLKAPKRIFCQNYDESSRDHVHPRSKGGTKTVNSCLQCNKTKADLSESLFRRILKGEINKQQALELAKNECGA